MQRPSPSQTGQTAPAKSAAHGWIVAVGLGLAAIQIVPMLDYFPEAQRNLNQ